MDIIKELTDFYMWMLKNDYDHNIRARVEKKAQIFLNSNNIEQSESINPHSVINRYLITATINRKRNYFYIEAINMAEAITFFEKKYPNVPFKNIKELSEIKIRNTGQIFGE